MQDDEVINAELNEEEMNRNDKEFSKEEEKEKEIWDPVKGQEFLQAELAKECEDVEIEDKKERERIQKIFKGEDQYEPDPQMETLYLEWSNPEEQPPKVREKKRTDKTLTNRSKKDQRKRKMAIREKRKSPRKKRRVNVEDLNGKF